MEYPEGVPPPSMIRKGRWIGAVAWLHRDYLRDARTISKEEQVNRVIDSVLASARMDLIDQLERESWITVGLANRLRLRA